MNRNIKKSMRTNDEAETATVRQLKKGDFFPTE